MKPCVCGKTGIHPWCGLHRPERLETSGAEERKESCKRTAVTFEWVHDPSDPGGLRLVKARHSRRSRPMGTY